MKRSPIRRSRKKPATTAEKAHMERVSQLPCLACEQNERLGFPARGDGRGVQVHHTKKAFNQRAGHMLTLALCPWHHDSITNLLISTAASIYGPSLKHDARQFHEIYGSDTVLLEMQELLLKEQS